jgi:hypothetical protein
VVSPSPVLHPNSYSHTRFHRSRSSISEEIKALPSSSIASLERVRERSVQPHPPSIRRLPDPIIQDPLAPIPNPVTELKNPVKDPNWPDKAFTKPASEVPHLASQVNEQIEKWTCPNIECKTRNQKHVRKCEECGWKLPETYHVNKDGQRINVEGALRQLADGKDDTKVVPTGRARGGGVWIPAVPGQENKERQPNVLSEDSD